MADLIFRDKKIFYRIEGQGKPVMLLHGFAEDGKVWNNQVEILKRESLLIIPDLPGSGNSEKLEGNCRMDDYAEVIKAIVDQELKDHKTFSMIGHSMGGYITIAFAEKYPALLNSFGFFHSSSYSDDTKKIEIRKKGIEFIKNNGVEAFLKTSAPNLFSQKTKKERPDLIEKLIKLGVSISAETLIQYYEAMMSRPDRTHVLKSFSKPVLFIIGKNDTAVPIDASLEQSHIPAISSIHILQDSAHMGMWEETELTTEILSNFLTLQSAFTPTHDFHPR